MVKKQTNVLVVTLAVFMATFMTAIEGTIVSTAMATIVGSLDGLAIMNWVFSIYLLTNVMMTPIYGKLADRIGRKAVFIIGTIIFIVGSSLCGFAQDMMQLIIFRAIQGVGAGAIMPVALTIIADIYPAEKRAKVLGFNNAAWGIASIVGPLFGGFIVDVWTWHWIFFINVPIGLVLMVLIYLFLVEPKNENKVNKSMDIGGSLTLMGFLLFLLYGFQSFGDQVGLSIETVVIFLFAIICLIFFIRIEKKAEDPVISLHLFKNKTFVLVNVIALLVSGFLMGIEVYIPMWMQGILGKSATFGGLTLTPLSLLWVLGSFAAGIMMERLPMKRILQIGLGFIIVGGSCLLFTKVSTPYIAFLGIAMIIGIGMGITITVTTVKAQNSVTPKEIGVATSFNTLARTLGQTIMVSLFGVIMNYKMMKGLAAHKELGITKDLMNKLINPHTASSLPADLLKPLRGVLYTGLHSVYFVGVGLLLVAFLFNQMQKKEEIKN